MEVGVRVRVGGCGYYILLPPTPTLTHPMEKERQYNPFMIILEKNFNSITNYYISKL
jgi:hypothetical protein